MPSINNNESNWNSITLIRDFLQDMQHMVLFYELNPSELEGHLENGIEGILIDRFGELVERMGYRKEELYK